MIRVLIADDQELIRDSLSILLSSSDDIEVIDTAIHGVDALNKTLSQKPDVLLLDIRMPVCDGLQIMERLTSDVPDTKIIILTTFDDDEYIETALSHSASGYLLKSISRNDLIKAVKTVNDGGSLFNPDVASKVVKMFSRMARADYRTNDNMVIPENITPSELRILKRVGMGLSNKEITYEMNISEGTARNYISSILQKLGLRDRTQLAIYAVQNGISLLQD